MSCLLIIVCISIPKYGATLLLVYTSILVFGTFMISLWEASISHVSCVLRGKSSQPVGISSVN